MKKLVCGLLIIGIFFASVSAQFSFSIQAGAGTGTFKDFVLSYSSSGLGFPDQYFKNTITFYGGINVQIPLSNVLSLESGLFYAPRTGNIEADSTSYLWSGSAFVTSDRMIYKAEISLTYIEMPLLLKVHAGDLTPYAGISGAFLISNKMPKSVLSYEYDSNGNEIDVYTIQDYTDADINDCLKSVVLKAQLGIEYNLSQHIFIDLRYVMGLTSLEKYYDLTTEEAARIAALPTAEFQQWYNEHPFFYTSDNYPDSEKNASIETINLYVMLGYKF